MIATQAAATLRKAGVHWPHVSRADIDRLLANPKTKKATTTLLATVPDDSEIEVVTEMDEDGKALATKMITNPTPMYKQLGFAEKSELVLILEVSDNSGELKEGDVK